MANRTQKLAQDFNRAVACYQAGKFNEAEQICQQIVSIERDFFDALRVLAVVQATLGKNALALASYDRALTLRPNDAEVLSNRGNALKDLKRFDEALTSYDRALALRPDYAAAHSNRGSVLTELKRFDEALASYDRALVSRPDYVEALYNRGNILFQLKRFDEALASYDRTLSLRPNLAAAFSNRGNVLRELKRFDEALASYDRALGLQPNLAEAFSNRGMVLQELKRLDEALASYDRALGLQPDYALALYNRGVTLHALKRHDEALANYDRALGLQPDYAEALTNRGITLHALKRLDEALASYDRALGLKPDYATAFNNRGILLSDLMRHDEALASYQRAIASRPDFAEAHWNEGLLRLLTGDFSRGWAKYEWRWKKEPMSLSKRDFPQPLWLGGEAIDGKTVLLHSEQGLGDTIQFCRYVPLVAARGARVIFEVEKPLAEIAASLSGAAQIIPKGNALPDFDLQCPLLSLPLALGMQLETIPSDTPYLHAPSQGSIEWGARLGANSRPRIGLAWSGNVAVKEDRSTGLRALQPILDIEASFISVQKDVLPADAAVLEERGDIAHFGDELRSFSDTAALISNLDLVISVDTSVAHLAGALGKPVWVLLNYAADWRWLLRRDDSPWYPTARLFRQDESRTWDRVIVRVREALLGFVDSRRDETHRPDRTAATR